MDAHYMEHALRLAEAGRGQVSPNPLVGAVLVHDGRIIGEGYHASYGAAHAEQQAIDDARRRGHDPRGATLYCTLEPCSFTAPDKHNPPCTLAIRNAGLAEVVVAITDPNPRVSGDGLRQLRAAGIRVRTGLLSEKAVHQNEAYILSREFQRPFVHLKWAQSIDGCIATHSGDSKWISSYEARSEVHRQRYASDAILVGGATVRADNPQLTVRLPETEVDNPPLRVVLSGSARIPANSYLIRDAEAIPTRIYTGSAADPDQLAMLRSTAAKVIQLSDTAEPSAAQVLEHLYASGIRSVFVEGGSGIHSLLLQAGLYDRVCIFTEPLFLGNGLRPTAGIAAPDTVAVAPRLVDPQYRIYGSSSGMTALHPQAAAVLRQISSASREAECSLV